MPKTMTGEKNRVTFSIMDTLLYILAGSAMAMITVSFLLWLRF